MLHIKFFLKKEKKKYSQTCLSGHQSIGARSPHSHIEPGDAYARSPSPESPISRKRIYTPYLGYWLPLAIKINTPFWGLSQEIFLRVLPKIPPFPEKMGIRMRPPHAFDGGGGQAIGVTCLMWPLKIAPEKIITLLKLACE